MDTHSIFHTPSHTTNHQKQMSHEKTLLLSIALIGLLGIPITAYYNHYIAV